MSSATRKTAEFAEMRHTLMTTTGADGSTRRLFGPHRNWESPEAPEFT